jgi:hypothetical protein
METSDKPDLKGFDLTKTKEYFELLADPNYEDPLTKLLKSFPVIDGIIQIPIGLENKSKT